MYLNLMYLLICQTRHNFTKNGFWASGSTFYLAIDSIIDLAIDQTNDVLIGYMMTVGP